jgi:hypothetical protein
MVQCHHDGGPSSTSNSVPRCLKESSCSFRSSQRTPRAGVSLPKQPSRRSVSIGRAKAPGGAVSSRLNLFGSPRNELNLGPVGFCHGKRGGYPLFHHVSNAIGPPATAHPFDVLLEPDHWGLFPLRLPYGQSLREPMLQLRSPFL